MCTVVVERKNVNDNGVLMFCIHRLEVSEGDDSVSNLRMLFIGCLG